jgi:NAD(P)-dependent dehydrogenase (short-subunit alcohol dehydrogenase family)
MVNEFYNASGFIKKCEAVAPAEQIGQPQDAADPILFAKSLRCAYVNGASVLRDGGFVQSVRSIVLPAGSQSTKS